MARRKCITIGNKKEAHLFFIIAGHRDDMLLFFIRSRRKEVGIHP